MGSKDKQLAGSNNKTNLEKDDCPAFNWIQKQILKICQQQ